MHLRGGFFVCVLVIVALGAAGCSSSPSVQGDSVRIGTEPGLDIETWFLAETPLNASGRRVPLEAALGPYLGLPTPLVTGSREICEINGIRIVTVPTAMVNDIRARVPLAGPIMKQGTVEVPDWVPIIVGPRFDGPLRLRLDSGQLRLNDPGRMRVLLRAWLTAMPEEVVTLVEGESPPAEPVSSRAAMYIEFVPQYVPERALERRTDPMDTAPSIDNLAPVDAGTPFPRLKIALMLQPGESVVLMLGNGGGDSERPAELVGPMLPADAVIGDALFTDKLVVPSRGVQTAVLITARGPAEFRLTR